MKTSLADISQLRAETIRQKNELQDQCQKISNRVNWLESSKKHSEKNINFTQRKAYQLSKVKQEERQQQLNLNEQVKAQQDQIAFLKMKYQNDKKKLAKYSNLRNEQIQMIKHLSFMDSKQKMSKDHEKITKEEKQNLNEKLKKKEKVQLFEQTLQNKLDNIFLKQIITNQETQLHEINKEQEKIDITKKQKEKLEELECKLLDKYKETLKQEQIIMKEYSSMLLNPNQFENSQLQNNNASYVSSTRNQSSTNNSVPRPHLYLRFKLKNLSVPKKVLTQNY